MRHQPTAKALGSTRAELRYGAVRPRPGPACWSGPPDRECGRCLVIVLMTTFIELNGLQYNDGDQRRLSSISAAAGSGQPDVGDHYGRRPAISDKAPSPARIGLVPQKDGGVMAPISTA